MYTCDEHCLFRGLGLFNEDGWPSIPRTNNWLQSVVEGMESNQWGVMVLSINITN